MKFLIEITKQLKIEAENKEELYQKIKEIESNEDDLKNKEFQIFGNDAFPVLLAEGKLEGFKGNTLIDEYFKVDEYFKLGKSNPTRTAHISYIIAEECKNEDAFDNCIKCGKCGRVFAADGTMIDDGGTTPVEE